MVHGETPLETSLFVLIDTRHNLFGLMSGNHGDVKQHAHTCSLNVFPTGSHAVGRRKQDQLDHGSYLAIAELKKINKFKWTVETPFLQR